MHFIFNAPGKDIVLKIYDYVEVLYVQSEENRGRTAVEVFAAYTDKEQKIEQVELRIEDSMVQDAMGTWYLGTVMLKSNWFMVGGKQACHMMSLFAFVCVSFNMILYFCNCVGILRNLCICTFALVFIFG